MLTAIKLGLWVLPSEEGGGERRVKRERTIDMELGCMIEGEEWG